MNGVDETFVRERTVGFEQARDAALAADWEALEHESGVDGARRCAQFARLLVERPNADLRLVDGADAARARRRHDRALINVGARARPARPSEPRPGADSRSLRRAGRRRSRLRPDRSTQATAARWSEVWEFPVAPGRGWTAPEMVDHAAAGDVDLFWIVGGNFLETLPDAERSRARARASAAPHSPRHRAVVVDARRQRRRRAASCRRRRATNRKAAAPKRRPSGASSSRRRFRDGGSAARGRSGGCSAKRWRGRFPIARNYIRFDSAAAIRARNRACDSALSGHRDAGGQGRSDSVGRPRRCLPTAGLRRRTARRTSLPSRLRPERPRTSHPSRPTADDSPSASSSRRGAASSSTR